jgi:GNAT superfamily N-acetyltransferase
MRKKDFEGEVRRFVEVYNAAWEKNWAFVPLTDAEIKDYAKQLKPLLDESWAWIAEKDGETVGAALTLLDWNQVLAKLHGRILPFGWLRFLTDRKKITRVRVFALGVKPEFQHTGVAAKFYVEHFDESERSRVKGGEMGWILEVNTGMNRGMEAMGGRIVKRYRLFEKRFGEE